MDSEDKSSYGDYDGQDPEQDKQEFENASQRHKDA
jgi:hypothetical protein